MQSLFTPSSIVADSVTGAGRDALEAAYLNALTMLHEQAVNMLVSSEGATTYFVAAPARDFPVAPGVELCSPLSAALPGNPGHQGDAGYMARCKDGWAVVARQGSTLQSTTGPEELCRSFVEQLDLRLVVLDAEAVAPWVSYNLSRERHQARVNLAAIASASAASLVAALAWVAGTLLGPSLPDPVAIESARAEAQTRMRAEIAGSIVVPALASLSDMQALAMSVSEAGGYLLGYAIDEKGVAWKASLPGYTTPERIQALGSGLETRSEGGRLLVERKAKE